MSLIATKIKKLWNKAVDNFNYALEFVPDCSKTQKMCVKASDTCSFVFDSVLDWYRTKEMCDKVVDNFLPALNWFVTNKMIKNLLILFSLVMI